MIGVYFSGTGNTKFCVEYFVRSLDKNAICYSIEDKNTILEIAKNNMIILGYPIYYSNLPKILRDFICNNSEIWNGKQIYIITTMGLFSGDGAGVSARLLKKFNAEIMGGLHLQMPDCIGDVKALKKPLEKNRQIVYSAKRKIDNAVQSYESGKPTQDGLNTLNHLAGLFGQRLYFYSKTRAYTDKLKIDKDKCIGCGKCQSLCPMKNILVYKRKAISGNSCTMCYRCINNCPKKAITLIGKKVIEQCRIEKYI